MRKRCQEEENFILNNTNLANPTIQRKKKNFRCENHQRISHIRSTTTTGSRDDRLSFFWWFLFLVVVARATSSRSFLSLPLKTFEANPWANSNNFNSSIVARFGSKKVTTTTTMGIEGGEDARMEERNKGEGACARSANNWAKLLLANNYSNDWRHTGYTPGAPPLLIHLGSLLRHEENRDLSNERPTKSKK